MPVKQIYNEIIEHHAYTGLDLIMKQVDDYGKLLMTRSNILHNKSKQNIYSTLSLEELNDVVSIKMVEYLHQESIKPIPMTKSPQDRMMLYEERLAAEKQLFNIYRQAVYLLDIVIDSDEKNNNGEN